VSPRTAAAVALLVLGAAYLLTLTLTTPWSPATGGPPVSPEVSRDFTPADVAREDAFHSAVRPPAYAAIVVGLAVSAALGLTPLGARLVSAVARPLGGGVVWQVLLGTVALTVLGRLATLPFSARAEVVLRRYGLSTQTWGSWAVDVAKGVAVSAVIAAVALLGFYAIARAAPRTWWAWAAAGGAALVVVVSFVWPLLVEPVFNRFESLPAGPLRASLIELAEQDGVPVRDVLVADASRRTSALNAYVSGFGSTRRLVVYDTLIREAPPEEVRLIVAHELGHAARRDVLYGTLLGAAGLAVGCCALFLLLNWAPLLRRAGVTDAGDPRSLALVLLLAGLAGLASSPVQSLVSRRIEARADVHALNLTEDPATFAAMQRRLARTNLSDLDPHPLVYGMFASHPTAPERIALARSWARGHDVRLP